LPETQAARPASDILARIVETKRAEVRELRGRRGELEVRAERAPAPLDFAAALMPPGAVALIAEVKRRSPGAGEIRPGLDPVELARGYAAAGASALSVLTDRDYFGGSLRDLEAIRAQVPLPLLRKDFLIHPLQLLEARGAGADTVLLIVRILEDPLLAELLAMARAMGMEPLVEVHEAEELDRALEAGARVIGVNNRDLRTFTTRLEVTTGHLPRIPLDRVVVSESGIRSREDVELLGEAGVHAVLVGETLLRAPDAGAAAAGLAGVSRRER